MTRALRALAAIGGALLLGGGAAALLASGRAAPSAPVEANAAAAVAEPVSQVAPEALHIDCSDVGDRPGGRGYQFIDSCAGQSSSPDGRFAVAMRDGGVVLTDAAGDVLDEIPSLADAMPFVLFWSPRSDWFFANHYLGSGLERLRVFEIVNRTAIERSAVFAEAMREMVRRYPCLARHAHVFASGQRWGHDGRRIVLVAYARTDACLERDGEGNWNPVGDWNPLLMIGDAEAGRIDPASVRERRDDDEPMPTDGPYGSL